MTEEELQIEIESLCRQNGFLLLGDCESEGIWAELCLIKVGGKIDTWIRENQNYHPAFRWVKEPRG